MKCFGEHDLFQHLASFLHRNTAVKLYSSGRTFKSVVKRKFSGLFLRLAMTSLIEEDRVINLLLACYRASRSKSMRLSKQEHAHIMHHLTRVLQNCLNLHRRESGATMVWGRYHVNKPLETNGDCVGRNGMCLPMYVRSSWHFSCHNVGILMVTREQYVKARASRMRLDLEWIRRKRQILRRELRYDA